ncbi:M15 family metallopeptidase [Paenibacillus hamazuiensis]|uniref:M15 family metallopeptidase n=1 Tax=Paenibacillus hamazuiensis TaxID=2936508 RepID=UPI00200BCDC0|nr:M15 family metallopeptidase [Paenibacillus hamazuiensis]
MKKRLFFLAILALIGYAAAQHPSIVNRLRSDMNPGQQKSAIPNGKELTVRIAKDQIYKGDLLLVNKDHPVPEGAVESEAVNLFQHKELVQGFGLSDNTIRLSRSMVQRFSAMTQAASKDGVRHFLINSGYRDSKEQTRLYREMGAAYAMPAGYSEHNLGLSLDIGSTQGEMNRAPEGQWLKKNAWKHGFVLRYPKDKTDITGIQYEPWHFRYVGLPHSAIMQENDMVLEQYLDFLKERKTVTKNIGRQTYTVTYYPVPPNTTVRVPANARYEISGNNMDGVIVTAELGTDKDPSS